ncbi:zinc finger, RING/FYVE/PHD-type containing protein [Tanacetum coccineum]|uniref:Zinc finger, RING/FYVE/PHD-type containing protein n=1 Tax=Tanacetum coccineum TaxID=301880 RepID=A0ABQ5ED47_9ASTR
MGDENDRSIETELEYEEEEEEEEEEEKEEVIEFEDEDEDELDEDELEELEEMTPPRLSCWVGADGKQHHEIVVIDNDINNILKNKLHMIEPCSICYLPFSTRGNHRICCLPCGHLYGLSCIKKWLIQSSSGGKCPQCNTLCKYKDVILLYASRVCASAHQKASSTRHFPFTKKGLTEFREHERLRRVDTEKMHAEDSKKLVDVLKHQFDVVNKQFALLTQGADLLTQAKELEQRDENLGQADALRRGARALKWRARALGRRCAALGRRADVLEQRTDELESRLSAFNRSSNFFNQMYKEHLAQVGV